MKKYVSIALALILFSAIFGFAFVHNNVQQNQSIYKITTDDPQWKSLKTTAAQRAAVAIDEDEISDFSTKQLLDATLDYPLIPDLFFFDTNDLAIEKVSEHCTALRLLLQREDCADVINSEFEKIHPLAQNNNARNNIIFHDMVLDILNQYVNEV